VALTPGLVTAGTTARAAALNQIINLLRGLDSQTLDFILKSQAASDFVIQLSDNAGVRKLIVKDSDAVEVAALDSNGNLTTSGYARLKITDTDGAVNGYMWLDDSEDAVKFVDSGGVVRTILRSVDNADILGSGAATDGFVLTADGAGGAAWEVVTTIGSGAALDGYVLAADGAGGSAWELFPDPAAPLLGRLTDLMPTRYLVAYFGGGVTASAVAPIGIGFRAEVTTGTISAVAKSRSSFDSGGASSQIAIRHGVGITPARSPLLAARATPHQTNTNLREWLLGFFASLSATANGAYFRRTTTGNVFAVTRQTTETVTDLGALNDATLREWRVYTNDAGVTWLFEINGAVVATHTTNVPTASVELTAGSEASSLSGGSASSHEVERLLVVADIP